MDYTERNKYLANKLGCNFIINFSGWTQFGVLFEWTMKQDWLRAWQGYTDGVIWDWTESACYSLDPAYINPDMFANSVYDYLRSRDDLYS